MTVTKLLTAAIKMMIVTVAGMPVATAISSDTNDHDDDDDGADGDGGDGGGGDHDDDENQGDGADHPCTATQLRNQFRP